MRAILIKEALGIMKVILMKEVLPLARGRGAFSISIKNKLLFFIQRRLVLLVLI
jgi:hypothetical protein